MPFQPQPSCLTDVNLPSYGKGVAIFLILQLIILFLIKLHSIPILKNYITTNTQVNCQMFASNLALVSVLPIMAVTFDFPTFISASYDKILNIDQDQKMNAIADVITNGVITIGCLIFIVAYMYFIVESNTFAFSEERRKYMENPEEVRQI
jgi:hypothetical protein